MFTETLIFFKKYMSQDISTRENILLILKSTDKWFFYGKWKRLKVWKSSHKIVCICRFLSPQGHA